jgi:hypothetical protein
MKKSIIVTDLTRFSEKNPDACTAGIDRKTSLDHRTVLVEGFFLYVSRN